MKVSQEIEKKLLELAFEVMEVESFTMYGRPVDNQHVIRAHELGEALRRAYSLGREHGRMECAVSSKIVPLRTT